MSKTHYEVDEAMPAIKEIILKHTETVEAIMHSYEDNGSRIELMTTLESLNNEINNIEINDIDEVSCDDEAPDPADTRSRDLEKLEEICMAYGFTAIRINSLADQYKLESFISNIFPHYSERAKSAWDGMPNIINLNPIGI